MKALAIVPGTPGARLVDREEPGLGGPHDVKVRVLAVGICGTDREEVAGGRARAPDGRPDLVIGHEMVGRVVEVGEAVRLVAVGDHAVFTVRRGCGHCAPCRMGRADMCLTGDYRERGIWGLDGYQTAVVVDHEDNVVRLPPALGSVGVLVEPLSVVEKAIDEALRLQVARRPDVAASVDWLFGRRCLVAGLGPVGLLAAMVLVLRGAEVYGLDVVDADTPRPRWLTHIGGHYVDGRRVPAQQVADHVAPMELIVEAAGIARLEFNLLDALAVNGAYVMTGIPGGDRPVQVPAAALVRQLVLGNQVLVGSVNAARGHFRLGVDDLMAADLRWPGVLSSLITRHPVTHFQEALSHDASDAIKDAIDWDGA